MVKMQTTAAAKAFLELVRAGMHGTAPAQAPFLGLGEATWQEVYTMAKRQTVSGICCCALCRLPHSLLPPPQLLTRWLAREDAIARANAAMSAALTQLLALFHQADLHPVVQKGLSVARHYTRPELRECGDIDLWLSSPEMPPAVALIEAQGIETTRHADASTVFVFQGVPVELHPHLICAGSPATVRALDASAEIIVENDFAGHAIPAPAPLYELLLLNVHILHHAIGRGIGLRQICDYALAARKLHGSYDQAQFASLCRRIGIARWTATLNEFATAYLGSNPSELPPSGYKSKKSLPEAVLADIIAQGGNFGKHAPAGLLRGKARTAAMFLRRSRFAASTAPAEALRHLLRLASPRL